MTSSRMAAVAELSFLLFALINNIQAEELIVIREEQDSYSFNLPKEANFCLISRLVGEEKLILWNTSVLWSENTTVPEELKQRVSVVSWADISSYMIQKLTHSDSGQYREECWTEGKLTYERNVTITICSTIDETIYVLSKLEATVDLSCEEATDNLDIQWLKRDNRYKEDIWRRVSEDSTTSVTDSVEVLKNTSTLRISNFTGRIFPLYMCVVMNHQQCVSSESIYLSQPTEIIYHSVGETAVLQCTVTEFSDDQPPVWKKDSDLEVGQNYSLVLSSLTLNHSGFYSCKTANSTKQEYLLVVCPKFDPPAVELFSEGDDVTLRCRDWEQGMWGVWFMKINQTEVRILTAFDEMLNQSSRRKVFNSSLIISNVSLEDTGEYWCMVTDPDDRCVSTTKTLLKSRVEYNFSLYVVRSSVLIGLLVILCVVVVAVTQRTRIIM